MTQPSKATEMGSYTALAAFMAAYPDVAVFRTFSELNRKNLLYMQAEIAILEDELNDIADEDSKDTHRKDFATNWRSLAKECRENEKKARIAEMQGLPVQLQKTRDGWQWQTFLRIRKLLHEYNQALLQQSQLDALPAPHKNDIRELRNWFRRKEYGNNFLAGRLNPEWVWDAEKGYPDFVSMREQGGVVYQLARFFTYLTRCCDSGRRDSNRVYSSDGTSSGKTAKGISTVISTLLPVAPIFALAYIDPLWIRLLVILGFTAVFAAVLVFGVRLTPDQTLAVTLSCAAIQVVFVGSTDRWRNIRTENP